MSTHYGSFLSTKLGNHRLHFMPATQVPHESYLVHTEAACEVADAIFCLLCCVPTKALGLFFLAAAYLCLYVSLFSALLNAQHITQMFWELGTFVPPRHCDGLYQLHLLSWAEASSLLLFLVTPSTHNRNVKPIYSGSITIPSFFLITH